MNIPVVSILMSTFNDARYISKAIASVQSQDLTNWELIIINDASPDATADIIAEAASQDSRIVIITHTQNVGYVRGLNEGLKKSQGKFIARLDSDDVWADAKKLTAQVEFFNNNPDHALTGTFGVAIDEEDKPLFKLQFPQTDENIRKEILKHNCFIHSSVMFRADVVNQLGGYANSEGYVEDYELWLELGLKNKFAVLPIVGVNYRINPKGVTQTKSVFQWQAFINLMKKYRSDYPGFWPAYIKLRIQKLVLQLFGPKLLNALKRLILRHG